jgi:hypothetical protein
MGDFIPENCSHVNINTTYMEYDTGYDLGNDTGYDSDDVLEELYQHLEDNTNQEQRIERLIEREKYKKIESSAEDSVVGQEGQEKEKEKEQDNQEKKVLYNMPKETSKDARAIWKQANIPDISDINEIQYKLILWAVDNAEITINEDDTIKTINWNISGNSKCKATWVAFIHWMLCACVT